MNRTSNIRFMEGNPNSPYPSQQKPYFKIGYNGKVYDVNGGALPNKSLPEAHIPIDKINIVILPWMK